MQVLQPYQQQRARRRSFAQSLHLQYPQLLYFKDIQGLYKFSIKNISDEPLRFSLALSNPDNYQLVGTTRGFLQPDAELHYTIRVKAYDSVTSFNYHRNSIYVVSWGQQREVSCIELRVNTDGMKAPNQAVLEKVRTMVKVFCNGEEGKAANVDFIEKYLTHMGEIWTGRVVTNFTMYMFPHKVDIEPHVLQHQGALYSICYPSILTGHEPRRKAKLNPLQVPIPEKLSANSVNSSFASQYTLEYAIAFPTVSLSVTGNISGFFLSPCSKYIIWYNAQSVTLFELETQKQASHPFSQFRIQQLSHYLCVVVQQQCVHFFKSLHKYRSVNFRSIRPHLMTMTHDTLILYPRPKHHTGSTLWPFFSDNLAKDAAHKHNIYVYKKFNTRKVSLSPDERLTFSGKHHVESMDALQNLLVLYMRPEIVVYHLEKQQTIVKVEKNIKMLKILKRTPTVNRMNLVGLDGVGHLFKINIDGLGAVYGAEVVELLKEPIDLVSQGTEGALYLVSGSTVAHFSLGARKILKTQKITTENQTLVGISLSSECLIYLRDTQFGRSLQSRFMPDLLGYCQ